MSISAVLPCNSMMTVGVQVPASTRNLRCHFEVKKSRSQGLTKLKHNVFPNTWNFGHTIFRLDIDVLPYEVPISEHWYKPQWKGQGLYTSWMSFGLALAYAHIDMNMGREGGIIMSAYMFACSQRLTYSYWVYLIWHDVTKNCWVWTVWYRATYVLPGHLIRQ